MKVVDYPRFAENYSREELIEHSLLNEAEQEFITRFRGDVNRYAVAVLLKSLQYLSYFPQHLIEVPVQVRLFIAKQLDLVEMFVAMIHRIDVRAEKKRDRELLKDLKLVDGKTQILFRVAEAIVENPDGNIRDVIFPKVKEETFLSLVAEKEASGPQYQLLHQRFMKQKYAHHYHRMLPLVLENITFGKRNNY